MAVYLFYFLVFPGLLFAAVAGGFLSWFDRKITARVQFRKGPPLLQPFYDFFKLLLVKETILPKQGSPFIFLAAPVFALFGATTAAIFILLPLFNITSGFRGDLLVIFYLLTIPSFSYVIGSLASGNPLASVGGSREMKLIISYEMTFLLVIAGVIMKSSQNFDLYSVISIQQNSSPFIGSISGVLLFIVAIFCIQAKLGLVPFDMAEAETEINSGAFIEYSGVPYALIKLTKYIMLLILPAFITGLLLKGFNLNGINILWAVLKLAGVVLLLTLIRNTNPRLKIKQAVSFFMIWMNLIAVIAIVLAYFGY
ncbi:MAG TPA: NADH-quinone oxidoreductase subunit H [Bacteroidales bacterium]|nr:NADH-quinone oxidoreductase subunit H [Bacteroidales bacterium]HPF03185.1 NADH-quinone oxidoreductase subunit H [Bacteroidales bacterium]HPJ58308.1 NADH-quinone oxidoreductase subunit H [Bacteroidales bacterium]HPR10886.1 NADH-quinone oxidoreductase subunit H [Bacteroidales bacterium]